MKGRWILAALLVAGVVGLWPFRGYAMRMLQQAGVVERKTVASVLAEHEARVRTKFEPRCRAAKIAWPPARLTVIALKIERSVEVWAEEGEKRSRLVTYPITAASGRLGPKRQQGDRQVPEGIYRLTTLNPNSLYHLSVRVDYPNADDIANAAVPRSHMGGDIYIHGRAVSIGCIAIGDAAIEELFTMAALVKDRRIIIAPVDFRVTGRDAKPDAEWVGRVYGKIRETLRRYSTTQ